ncbi:MAG: efflux transporter periplasmic adaptor subunit [Campylobacteraceae bacterium 4484_166]|nr:MAG: efflux transporter periplasmic adaptor subunit [Campylobacteraceae bacterium 4484_166]
MRKILVVFVAIVILSSSLYATQIYATFTVKAARDASLAFNSSGTIKKIFVDITSEVKKGEKLAILQNDDRKSALLVARTALKYAKIDYNRQKKIKNIVSKFELDRYALKYETAEAQARYQLALFYKTILKAPFDGVIYDKLIEVGDVVSGPPKIVFKIQSKTARKLVLEFDQKYWKIVKVGQTFRYKVDGDNTTYESKISKIYPSASSSNRKIKAEVITKGFAVGLFGDGYILKVDR